MKKNWELTCVMVSRIEGQIASLGIISRVDFFILD